MVLLSSLLLLICSLSGRQWPSAEAFSLTSKRRASAPPLFLAKVKRGRLGSLAGGEVEKTKRRRTTTNRKQSDNTQDAGGISPALADWVASAETADADVDATTMTTTEVTVDATTYSAFEPEVEEAPKKKQAKPRNSKRQERRTRQAQRKAAEEQQDARVQSIVNQLQAVLEEKAATLQDILQPIRSLLALSSPSSSSLRQLTAGARRNDYRLAWVGSDEAVCHVGTGLHKVPLARLQEIFVSFPGRNRIEWQEVIRVLGPFPNVKNVLQGTSSSIDSMDEENVLNWQLTWESMIDGTGKEVMAGKTQDYRDVDLQVLYSDARVVVAVVPPQDGSGVRKDPFEENGKHVLVFVQEENLDEQLDKLRVA